MYSQFRKHNSNFNTLYFLVGSCHTADGAYYLIKQNLDIRKEELDANEVSKLRREAKKLKLTNELKTGVSDDRAIEIEADLLELKNQENSYILYLESAQDEYEFLLSCLSTLDSIRRYKDKSDIEGHEASQREEWKLELINRAQNHLLMDGRIPADQFDAMRMHPDFATVIYPEIKKISEEIQLSKIVIDSVPEEFRLQALKDKTNAIDSLEKRLLPKNVLKDLKLLGD